MKEIRLNPEQKEILNKNFQKAMIAFGAFILIGGIFAIMIYAITSAAESSQKHNAQIKQQIDQHRLDDEKLSKDAALVLIQRENLKHALILLRLNHGELYLPATDSMITNAIKGDLDNFKYWSRRVHEERKMIYEKAVDTVLLNKLRKEK